MNRVGIEDLDLYAGRCYLDQAELAGARGMDPKYVTGQLMCEHRTVLPPYEDSVTLAVNAAQRLLARTRREDIELLITATESGLDSGKPLATWVHRLCGLPARCRSLEVKHACYGCTGALKLAACWAACGLRPGKKALVINADCSRNGIGRPWEVLGGGCAVALLISTEPKVLELDLELAGYWTQEIADTFRPTDREEVIRDQTSLYSYLDALEGAFEHFEEVAGPLDFSDGYKKHIYHAPFPGMPKVAHRTLLARLGRSGSDAEASYREKVAGSIHWARRLGTCYGASNFVCLLGLLQTAPELRAGDRISLFSYGSGCQGEFYSARIGTEAAERARVLNVEGQIGERQRLSVPQYETWERQREELIGRPDFSIASGDESGVFERQYAGRHLLTLKEVRKYERMYEWC